MRLLNLKGRYWLAFFVYIAVNCQPAWANVACDGLLDLLHQGEPSEAEISKMVLAFRREQRLPEPIELTFDSKKGSEGKAYLVDAEFVGGSSKVFLTSDGAHVVKKYHSWSRLPMYEILMTEFLLENGMNVPAIIDFSDNIFEPEGNNYLYVVKEYKEGLNGYDRDKIGLTRDSELNIKVKEYRALMLGFKDWVSNHKYGDIYLERNGDSVFNTSGDLKWDNWIFDSEGWVLIDP